MSEAGTALSLGELSSPKVVAVENVMVSPRADGGDTDMDAVERQSKKRQSLAALNAAAPQLSRQEQDSVAHALAATAVQANAAASASSASSASASASPAAVARLSVSVRAADLLSPSWMTEATTFLALFSLEGDQYVLQCQTEVVHASNAPAWNTQLTLELPQGGSAGKSYCLRVYTPSSASASAPSSSASASNTVSEDDYMCLALFSLSDVLSSAVGGSLVTLTLPLIHPSDSAANDELRDSGAKVSLVFQAPSAGAGAGVVGQQALVYTRLLNPLVPMADGAHQIDVSVTASPSSASASSGAGEVASLWFKPRPTSRWELLESTLSGDSTIVLSDEVVLELEGVDGPAAASVCVLVHPSSAARGANHRTLARKMGSSLNTVVSSSSAAAAVGRAEVSLAALQASVGVAGGLVVPLVGLPGGRNVVFGVKARRSASASFASASSPSPAAAASFPSTLPPSVLAKCASLAAGGLYLTRVSSAPEEADEEVKLTLDAANKVLLLAPVGGAGSKASTFSLSSITAVRAGADEGAFELVQSAANPALGFAACAPASRDAFVVALLAAQIAAGVPAASWVPAAAPSGVTQKIVAAAKPAAAAASASASTNGGLGGSSGSLVRRPSGSVSAAAPAAADVDLSEVLVKLQTLFEAGRNFLRFSVGEHKPQYVSLFLRKDPVGADGKKTFKLFWCKADSRNTSDSRCMSSEEITGVALGKQTSVFRKEEASLAPASHCFSIIGTTRSLHLQSWNARDADTFSFGLASLLKQYGRTPQLYQPGQYSELSSRLDAENEREKLEESDGTLLISPQDVAALANQQSWKSSVELNIKCRNLPSKHANHIVCVFDSDNDTSALTYIAQTEKQATKINPEFRKLFKLQYDSSVARRLRFNVYNLDPASKSMEDDARMGSAMILLKEVVDGAGVEFVFRLTHENPDKQALLTKQGATIVIRAELKSEMQTEAKKQ